MRRPGGRMDAAVLTLLGLALLGAGGYGLARGYGAFGDGRADEPVLGTPVRDFVSRNGDWFWPVAAVVALLVAYAGLVWLLRQLRAGRVSRLDRTQRSARGTTFVRATSAADALARDVESYPGVRSASARLLHDGARPDVDLAVDVTEDADVPGIRQRIESHAFPRFRQALELEHLDARVQFRLSDAVSHPR
jgi:hypothetical protein